MSPIAYISSTFYMRPCKTPPVTVFIELECIRSIICIAVDTMIQETELACCRILLYMYVAMKRHVILTPAKSESEMQITSLLIFLSAYRLRTGTVSVALEPSGMIMMVYPNIWKAYLARGPQGQPLILALPLLDNARLSAQKVGRARCRTIKSSARLSSINQVLGPEPHQLWH